MGTFKLKLFTIILATIYFIQIPVLAYASIIQEANMVLKAAGKTKSASEALKLASQYKRARLVLGLGGTVTGTIGLGLIIYDLYKGYQDTTKVDVNLGAAQNKNPTTTGAGVVANWGSVNTSLSCQHTQQVRWHKHGSCPGYNTPNKYHETYYTCSYNTINYQAVGGITRVTSQNASVRDDCAGSPYTDVGSSITTVTYYMQSNLFTDPTGNHVGGSGSQISSSDLANTEVMQQTIAEAQQKLQDQTLTQQQLRSPYVDVNGDPIPGVEPGTNKAQEDTSNVPYIPVEEGTDYDLADPQNPPASSPEPTIQPRESALSYGDIYNAVRNAISNFFGSAPAVPAVPTYDSDVTMPEELSIFDLITNFLSNSPLLAILNGSSVEASGGTCSVSASAFGGSFNLDFCRWQSGFNTLGQLYLSVQTFFAVLYIFRKD